MVYEKDTYMSDERKEMRFDDNYFNRNGTKKTWQK